MAAVILTLYFRLGSNSCKDAVRAGQMLPAITTSPCQVTSASSSAMAKFELTKLAGEASIQAVAASQYP